MLSELALVKAIQPLNLCEIGSYYVNLTPWIYAAFIQLFSLFIQLRNKKTEINTTKQLLHELVCFETSTNEIIVLLNSERLDTWKLRPINF